MKPLYTPFSTHLSTSAREAELRLRSIFQWKKRRPPVILLAAVLAVAVGAGSLVGCNQPAPGTPEAPDATPAPTVQPAPEAAETTPPPAEQPEPGTADALGLFENDVASFAYPAGMEWDKQVGEDGTQYRFTPSVPGPGQVAEIRFSIFEGSYLELDAAPDAVQQQLEWNNGYLWDSAELEALQKTEIEGRPARWKTIRYEKDGTDYIEMTLELLDGGRGTAVEITALLEDRDHCEKAADTLDFHFAEPYLPYGRVAEFDTELWVMADMPEQCSWMRIEPQSQEDPIQGMEVYFPGGDTILQLWSQGNPARMPADLQTLATCAGMNGGTWHVLALPDDAAPQDELLLFLTGAGADTPHVTGRVLVARDQIESVLPEVVTMLESLTVTRK